MDDHTIQEIRGYNRPAPVVHNVMRSTYTLLGEKEGLDVGSLMSETAIHGGSCTSFHALCECLRSNKACKIYKIINVILP